MNVRPVSFYTTCGAAIGASVGYVVASKNLPTICSLLFFETIAVNDITGGLDIGNVVQDCEDYPIVTATIFAGIGSGLGGLIGFIYGVLEQDVCRRGDPISTHS